MPAKKYIIHLSKDERSALSAVAAKQRVDAQRQRRAKILLRTDQGPAGPAERDVDIAMALGIPTRQVERVRQHAAEAGPGAALERRPSTRVFQRKLDGRAEARLIIIAKEAPPDGRATWTMQLLADQLVTLGIVEGVDDNTVWRTLKKMSSSRI